MRISKKTMGEIAERFEAALDYIPALDKVPFHVKRDIADTAAVVAVGRFQEWKHEKKCAEGSVSGTWQVERWGGKASHKTRVIFIGSEDLARAAYARAFTKMRDGVVRLVNDRGELVERGFGCGCSRRRLS